MTCTTLRSAFVAAALATVPAFAQTYPAKPVRVVDGFAPGGSTDIVARMLAMPDVQERLLAAGLEPAVTTPEQFGEYIRRETAKWAKVVKAAGIEPQSY